MILPVTVHSVLSNTLRDAQKRQKSRFALLPSGFSRKNRVKTPRGAVSKLLAKWRGERL